MDGELLNCGFFHYHQSGLYRQGKRCVKCEIRQIERFHGLLHIRLQVLLHFNFTCAIDDYAKDGGKELFTKVCCVL